LFQVLAVISSILNLPDFDDKCVVIPLVLCDGPFSRPLQCRTDIWPLPGCNRYPRPQNLRPTRPRRPARWTCRTAGRSCDQQDFTPAHLRKRLELFGQELDREIDDGATSTQMGEPVYNTDRVRQIDYNERLFTGCVSSFSFFVGPIHK
jgi:hypothetical protein